MGAFEVWDALVVQYGPPPRARYLHGHHEFDISWVEHVRVPSTVTMRVTASCRCREFPLTVGLYDYQGDGRTLISTHRPYRGQPLLHGSATAVVPAGNYLLSVEGNAYWSVWFR
jgi:hypothetical protein